MKFILMLSILFGSLFADSMLLGTKQHSIYKDTYQELYDLCQKHKRRMYCVVSDKRAVEKYPVATVVYMKAQDETNFIPFSDTNPNRLARFMERRLKGFYKDFRKEALLPSVLVRINQYNAKLPIAYGYLIVRYPNGYEQVYDVAGKFQELGKITNDILRVVAKNIHIMYEKTEAIKLKNRVTVEQAEERLKRQAEDIANSNEKTLKDIQAQEKRLRAKLDAMEGKDQTPKEEKRESAPRREAESVAPMNRAPEGESTPLPNEAVEPTEGQEESKTWGTDDTAHHPVEEELKVGEDTTKPEMREATAEDLMQKERLKNEVEELKEKLDKVKNDKVKLAPIHEYCLLCDIKEKRYLDTKNVEDKKADEKPFELENSNPNSILDSVNQRSLDAAKKSEEAASRDRARAEVLKKTEAKKAKEKKEIKKADMSIGGSKSDMNQPMRKPEVKKPMKKAEEDKPKRKHLLAPEDLINKMQPNSELEKAKAKLEKE